MFYPSFSHAGSQETETALFIPGSGWLRLSTRGDWLNPIEMRLPAFPAEVTHCELFETKQASTFSSARLLRGHKIIADLDLAYTLPAVIL